MGLTKIVRIGGRLTLAIGVLALNLASANSITYFYGYSSPSLTAWQTEDAFASQNVPFVSQVSMVSGGTYSAWGTTYGNAATANAYTGMNNSVDSVYGGWGYSSSSFGNTAPTYNPVTFGTYDPWSTSNAISGNNTASPYSGAGSWSGTSYTNVNGIATWNAWQAPATSAPTDPPQAVAWQPVRDSLVPPVSSNIGTSGVVPNVVPPSNTNNNNPTLPGTITDPALLGTPEPASIGLMAAGLLSLLYLRKRRQNT